jgi:hypothetical protein
VRREALRLVLPFTLLTLGLVIALGLRPISTDRILGGYVIAVAALALEFATRVLSVRTSTANRSAFEQALEQKPVEPTRPNELVRMERELILGAASAGHLHLRLLPLLRNIAAARLGVDLERSPARARTALGDDVWELLRPDRPPPSDRNAPGVSQRQLERCVEALERI